MGDDATVTHEAPANAAPADNRTFWERIRPFWWMRGIVSAIALVGLADHLGLIRHEWLRIFHGVAARWNEWMAWIGSLINFRVPWIHLGIGDANFLTALSVFYLPFAVPFLGGELRSQRRVVRWMAIISVLIVIGAYIGALAPGDQLAPELYVIREPVLLWISRALLTLFMIALVMVLYMNARTYLKALVFTLTFFATLEVFYFVPLLQDFIRPIGDAVDPG